MKNLIAHIFKENYEECLAKSLINCHVKGLHSVMLVDKPEQRIRVFVTDKSHELYHNKTINRKMTVAIHPHHCNVSLIKLKGEMLNLTYSLCDRRRGQEINRYEYSSHITSGKAIFRLLEAVNIIKIGEDRFIPKSRTYMTANELHTVYVPKSEITAWVVIEGKEDKNYKPYSYSLADLTRFDDSELYIKPTGQTFDSIIKLL